MKRFVELPPEVVLALADGVAEADGVGEVAPVGDAAPSATLTWVLGTGAAAPFPASDGSAQAATAASMAAATAAMNAGCQRRRGREGFISKISYVISRGRAWVLRLRLTLKASDDLVHLCLWSRARKRLP
jgi:hypothetical protein